jgi:hypothetical protein
MGISHLGVKPLDEEIVSRRPVPHLSGARSAEHSRAVMAGSPGRGEVAAGEFLLALWFSRMVTDARGGTTGPARLRGGALELVDDQVLVAFPGEDSGHALGGGPVPVIIQDGDGGRSAICVSRHPVRGYATAQPGTTYPYAGGARAQFAAVRLV